MAKSQGVTFSLSAQQGSKNVQTGRPHSVLAASSLAKGVTTLDEFKYGFPSKGLSTASNKWWGNISPDSDEGLRGDGAASEPDKDKKHQSEELGDGSASSVAMGKEKCESGKEEDISPRGTELLVDVRKRALEEGQKALKLGVFRGYGAKKLGRRKRTLLLRIFKSSTPKQWIHEPS